MKQTGLSQKNAEVLAIQGVSFLASDDDRIARFMANSGMSADSLTHGIHDPAILAGVLDYLLSDDSLLLDFAEYAGVAPETPALARAVLPGFVPL